MTSTTLRKSILAADYPPTTKWRPLGDSEVPARFNDPEREYHILRQGAGLLDYSSCGPILLTGAGAVDDLQALVTRDVEFMFPDRCVMALLLADDGTVRDLVVIYRLAEGFLVETAFGQTNSTLAELSIATSENTEVRDVNLDGAIVGIEGPEAPEVLEMVVGSYLATLPFRGVEEATWEGHQLLVSRTGFTGEFGYKLFVPASGARDLWDRLSEHGAIPCGFDALEITMTEVRQPMFHHECIDGDPVTVSGLNWLVDPGKPGFRGRGNLLRSHESARRATVGFVAEDPECQLVPAGTAVLAAGDPAGTVVYSTVSPYLARVCGIARVDDEFAASGLPLRVAAHVNDNGPGNAAPRAVIRLASSPLVVPTSWHRRDL